MLPLWNAAHRPREEKLKQAINKGLATAILSLVAAHLVPITAALVLVFLDLRGYYIGGELSGPSGYDNVKLSGLQFAAKILELAMQGSLSVIIIELIRQELVAGEGIPFGAIFGSLQYSELSYLFSKEFLGTLQSKFEKPIVNIRLISLIIVGSLLALTVGPSSAIVMRPRLDNWPAGGTDFYLNTNLEDLAITGQRYNNPHIMQQHNSGHDLYVHRLGGSLLPASKVLSQTYRQGHYARDGPD